MTPEQTNKFLTLLMGGEWKDYNHDHLANPLPILIYIRSNHFEDIWIPWIRENFEGVNDFHIPFMLGNFLNWTMKNLVRWLVENPAWGEKECDRCMGLGRIKYYMDTCPVCLGTGKVIHPALVYLKSVKEEE